MLNIKEGDYVKLRNGEICGPIEPYDGEIMVWTAKRLKDGHLLTWSEEGFYNFDKASFLVYDIIEIVPNPNITIDAKSKPINRINREDVENFRNNNYVGNALNQYQRIATQSAIYPGRKTPFGLMYAALGLAEAGEVQNKVKKAFRDDGILEFDPHGDFTACYFNQLSPERRAQIIKELGGALWYISAVCDEIDATLLEVAIQNLEELCSRGERGTLQGDGDNR